jgi:hypothetical protein
MLDKLTRLLILAVVVVALIIGVQIILNNAEASCSRASLAR